MDRWEEGQIKLPQFSELQFHDPCERGCVICQISMKTLDDGKAVELPEMLIPILHTRIWLFSNTVSRRTLFQRQIWSEAFIGVHIPAG